MGKFEIQKSSSGKFRWVFKGFQNAILLTSTWYENEMECFLSIVNCQLKTGIIHFHKRSNNQGHLYFEQVDNQGNIICKSTNYNSELALELAIRSMKTLTEVASVQKKITKDSLYSQ